VAPVEGDPCHVFACGGGGPGFGQELKYKPLAVTTPDGLTISAQDWGNPTGPEIL
jgi:hypothetical protein